MHNTKQKISEDRRNNSMMLALLFAFIIASMVFAFGQNMVYVVALIALPFVLVRGYEAVNRSFSARKPQRIRKNN